MEKQRLDKLIASQSGLSRSKAREQIRAGAVLVGGAVCRDAGRAVDPEQETVTVAGRIISYKKYVYLLMNKPAGVLSASRDKTRRTVVDLVPEALRRRGLFPVGRLDRDTTGLLILTDDGAFAHDVISPKKQIPKTYLAELDGALPDGAAERFLAGVVLADGTKCRPALLEPLEGGRARLTLCEGKYHEVKRMFGTEGLGVISLHRESIGELHLPDGLAPGECVEMPPNWLNLAQKTAGYTFLTK